MAAVDRPPSRGAKFGFGFARFVARDWIAGTPASVWGGALASLLAALFVGWTVRRRCKRDEVVVETSA